MRVLLAVLSLAVAVSALGAKFGPKGTIVDFTVNDCYMHSDTTYFVADKANLCWFWQCRQDKSGKFELLPRRCALGSKMPSRYIQGASNPCKLNFNTKIDFDCTRSKDQLLKAVEPSCFSELDCKNNGTARYEDKVCWCECTAEWRGATDCSKPTVEVKLNITGGKDEKNCWKDVSPCEEANGCENGGTCHDTCKDFWCECPVPFTAGKRCEEFDCLTNPCKNGGNCSRGQDDKDEVATCACPDGFEGLLCEKVKPTTTTIAATTTATIQTAATEEETTQAAATKEETAQTATTGEETAQTAATDEKETIQSAATASNSTAA